jgi:hypothetical protein
MKAANTSPNAAPTIAFFNISNFFLSAAPSLAKLEAGGWFAQNVAQCTGCHPRSFASKLAIIYIATNAYK